MLLKGRYPLVKVQANKKTFRKKAWDKKIKIKQALKVVEEIKKKFSRGLFQLTSTYATRA